MINKVFVTILEGWKFLIIFYILGHLQTLKIKHLCRAKAIYRSVD